MAEKLKLKIAALQQRIHELEAELAAAKTPLAKAPKAKPKASKPKTMTTRRRKSADD